MNTKTQNIIKEEMTKLPERTQKSINSIDWVNISENIGKKYLLNDEQINNLQLETFLVLIGLVNEDKYIENLKKYIKLDENKILTLEKDVVEKIITPVINYYKNSNNSELQKTLDFILSNRK